MKSIIKDIGYDLNIDMFTSAPLSGAGNATVKANGITYDVLLTKILENTKFSFTKTNGVYYFGDDKQTSLISSVSVPLLVPFIEILTPGNGSVLSLTVPETVFSCAKDKCTTNARNSVRIPLNFVLIFLIYLN